MPSLIWAIQPESDGRSTTADRHDATPSARHSGRYAATNTRSVGYWVESARSLKIRIPRYLFIQVCLCG